jgi:hypothetical protein
MNESRRLSFSMDQYSHENCAMIESEEALRSVCIASRRREKVDRGSLWNLLLDTSISTSCHPQVVSSTRRNDSSDATRDGSAGSAQVRNAAPNAKL